MGQPARPSEVHENQPLSDEDTRQIAAGVDRGGPLPSQPVLAPAGSEDQTIAAALKDTQAPFKLA